MPAVFFLVGLLVGLFVLLLSSQGSRRRPPTSFSHDERFVVIAGVHLD